MTKSTGPFNPPAKPPASWFANPGFTGPAPIRITNDGHITGHLAVWDSCHIGRPDRCISPPRAPGGSYSSFHTGQVLCADGSRVDVGQITVDSGHADLAATPSGAQHHYDHTGWAGADVACGEDEFGIWLAGSVRPGLDDLQARKLMGADVSGDWRRMSGALQLVGVASVNVPGFSKTAHRVGSSRDSGQSALVASGAVMDPATRLRMRLWSIVHHQEA